MKNVILLFLFYFGFLLSSKASVSQIILIDAEAYLVEIENDYDVVKVHHRVYDYFSSPDTHEVLLASAIDLLNIDRSIGQNEQKNNSLPALKDSQVVDNKGFVCDFVCDNNNKIKYFLAPYHSRSISKDPSKIAHFYIMQIAGNDNLKGAHLMENKSIQHSDYFFRPKKFKPYLS